MSFLQERKVIAMVLKPVHIDINKDIQDWQTERLGKKVRKASVNAFTKLQDQMNGAVDYLVEKGETVDQAARDVQTVRQAAQGAVDHANTISDQNKQYVDGTVAEYKQYADTTLTETTQQRQLAETAKTGADSAATLSQSWAEGGTGTRPGEDGDNSKLWAEKSQADADRSSYEADRAAKYASIVAPGFYLDPETMTLYQKAGVGVVFIVTEDKELCWKVA